MRLTACYIIFAHIFILKYVNMTASQSHLVGILVFRPYMVGGGGRHTRDGWITKYYNKEQEIWTGWVELPPLIFLLNLKNSILIIRNILNNVIIIF